jgi:hypothetical protein
MSDYARWRSHENDFRELQRQHPELFAGERSKAGEWVVRGDGRDAFESMAAIAAMDAGHPGEKHRWLDLVKAFLLDRSSEHITCIQLGSASGIGVSGDSLQPDDPAVRRVMLCTIRPVCQASGDYCLELAKVARRAESSIAGGLASPDEGSRKVSTAGRIPDTFEADAPFLRRAAWLQTRLLERSWNKHDPKRQRGPDPKTIDRILLGKAVREDVLEKLAKCLSTKCGKVTTLDIPQD